MNTYSNLIFLFEDLFEFIWLIYSIQTVTTDVSSTKQTVFIIKNVVLLGNMNYSLQTDIFLDLFLCYFRQDISRHIFIFFWCNINNWYDGSTFLLFLGLLVSVFGNIVSDWKKPPLIFRFTCWYVISMFLCFIMINNIFIQTFGAPTRIYATTFIL